MLLVGIAVWLLVASFGIAIVVGGNRKPSPISRELREDLEVMRLEAMWDVPFPQEERS